MSELPPSASTSDATVEVSDASEALNPGPETVEASGPERALDQAGADGTVKRPSRWATARKRLVGGLRSLVQPPSEEHGLLWLIQGLVLFALLGMALGAYVWWITHWNDFGKHATANTLPLKTRNLMFRYFLAGAFGVTLVSGVWGFLSGRSLEQWRRVAVRLSPAILIGMVPVIYN